jgi:hypothetical protein
MIRRLALLILLLLAACEPEPTPFPVDLPVTPTDPAQATEPPLVRYALAANTEGFVAELELIAAGAVVEQLREPVDPADLGARYDIVAAYGDYDGWTRSDITPQVALVIDSQSAPLTPALAAVIRRGIDPAATLASLDIPGALPVADSADPVTPGALRAELANLGRPDGLRLALAYAYTPGADEIAGQLAAINVDTRRFALGSDEIGAALAAGSAHLALVTWTTPDERAVWVERFGAEHVTDLYALPISYDALPELTITLTPGGWPLARR